MEYLVVLEEKKAALATQGGELEVAVHAPCLCSLAGMADFHQKNSGAMEVEERDPSLLKICVVPLLSFQSKNITH